MTSGFRTVLKSTGWSLVPLFLVLVVFVGLLTFPGFMFAHETKYANLTIYSDEIPSAGFEPQLRAINARIKASTIDSPRTEHRIFLGHDKAVFGFVQDLRTG